MAACLRRIVVKSSAARETAATDDNDMEVVEGEESAAPAPADESAMLVAEADGDSQGASSASHSTDHNSGNHSITGYLSVCTNVVSSSVSRLSITHME